MPNDLTRRFQWRKEEAGAPARWEVGFNIVFKVDS